MFPLIAIAAFFILGVAFFVIGKDDFGIKRVKEVSNDTSTSAKGGRAEDKETASNKISNNEKELVNSESSSEIESTNNASD